MFLHRIALLRKCWPMCAVGKALNKYFYSWHPNQIFCGGQEGDLTVRGNPLTQSLLGFSNVYCLFINSL